MEEFSIMQIDGEVLALDTNQLIYHTMNQVAFDIWLACDGTRNPSDVHQALIAEHPELTLDAVTYGLSELEDAGVFEEADVVAIASEQSRPYSRRKVLMGGVALVPIVASITAPDASAQNSGSIPLGGACVCSSGPTCCQSGCCLELYAFPCNGASGCMEAVFANFSQVCIVPGEKLCVPGFPTVCVPAPWGAQCK